MYDLKLFEKFTVNDPQMKNSAPCIIFLLMEKNIKIFTVKQAYDLYSCGYLVDLIAINLPWLLIVIRPICYLRDWDLSQYVDMYYP